MNNILNLYDNFNFFLNLFALVNPIGILPIFISMTNDKDINEKRKINFITHISVAIILIFSLIIGEFFLKLFGISINSLQIAGGILIIIISIPMIIDKKNMNNIETKKFNYNNISVVPLALPLLAGPGAISSCIIWASKWNGIENIIILSMICLLFSIFCWFLFNFSVFLIKFIGENGIKIITKIMGLLLMSLGVEFITIGIKSTLM